MSDYDSDQGSYRGGSGSEPEVIDAVENNVFILYYFLRMFLGGFNSKIS